MNKAYLVLFNADGTRKKTYARGIFYQIEEETENIVPLVNGFNVQDVLNNGGKWLNDEEYLNLLQTKVYKEGADNA